MDLIKFRAVRTSPPIFTHPCEDPRCERELSLPSFPAPRRLSTGSTIPLTRSSCAPCLTLKLADVERTVRTVLSLRGTIRDSRRRSSARSSLS
jgi:hypothetical protein